MIKKTAIAFFIIFIISFLATPFYRPETARAVIGIADVVIDPAHIATTLTSWLQSFLNRSIDMGFKAILANLKKRVLDSLLDQTTAWIRGDTDGAPKFVTQPGKFLKDAADAAVGDVLVQTGLANLCQNVPQLGRLEIQLAKPTFSQRISCTLSQVIGNVEAFANNFEAGGLIGYQELLKPQNNRWGNEILIRDELQRQTAIKEEVVRQEVTLNAGTGSLGIKECIEWELIEKATKKPVPPGGSIVLIEENPLTVGSAYFISRSPNQPPPLNEADLAKNGGVHIDNVDTTKVEWRCNKDRITTPGAIIAEGLKSTVSDDKNFILSSEDVSTILGALLDAAINRLIKEGGAGFRAMTQSQTTTGGPPARTLDDFSTSTRDAARDATTAAQGLIDNAKQPFLRQINETMSIANEAFDSILNASTSLNASTTDLNTAGLLQVLGVIVARGSPSCSSADVVWATTELDTASTTTRQTITNKFTQIQSLKSSLTTLKNRVQSATSLYQISNIDSSTLANKHNEAIQLNIEAKSIAEEVQSKLTEARQKFEAACSPPTFP